MDITDLNQPIRMDRQLSRYLNEFIRRPTDFSSADRSFGSMIADPQLFMGPGGQVLDPSQSNAAAGTAYLGNRAGLESANMAQKGSFADLLMQAGGNIGALSALMTNLQANQFGSANSAMGGLLGGFL